MEWPVAAGEGEEPHWADDAERWYSAETPKICPGLRKYGSVYGLRSGSISELQPLSSGLTLQPIATLNSLIFIGVG